MASRKTKGLIDDQNEAVRRAIRDLIAQLGGSQQNAARAIGVSPSTITEILGGLRGAGTRVIAGLQAATGRSFEEITGMVPVNRTAPSPADLDPKELTRRTDVYMRASPAARRAFDSFDPMTTRAGAATFTSEWYMRRLLKIIDDDRDGLLPSDDELLPGARLEDE